MSQLRILFFWHWSYPRSDTAKTIRLAHLLKSDEFDVKLFDARTDLLKDFDVVHCFSALDHELLFYLSQENNNLIFTPTLSLPPPIHLPILKRFLGSIRRALSNRSQSLDVKYCVVPTQEWQHHLKKRYAFKNRVIILPEEDLKQIQLLRQIYSSTRI
jgi:hypothetical protein